MLRESATQSDGNMPDSYPLPALISSAIDDMVARDQPVPFVHMTNRWTDEVYEAGISGKVVREEKGSQVW